MESPEIFLYTFILSHYVFKVVFVSWLARYGTADALTNYGLPN